MKFIRKTRIMACMPAALYPLRFQPILRRYLWGGRRLATDLGKPLGEGGDYAESWEVCDRAGDQSTVAHGPLKGLTLGELMHHRRHELLGRHHACPQFPLLFKFLDAQRTLSVQVHPDNSRAAREQPPDLGKTEAWVVLAADPGSLIYAGLRQGIDRPALQRALAEGQCESCLHRFQPRAGDCVFLPAGVVHAIGSGLLIAEIQQASDLTYRLFDFNRLGPDGKPRQLHIDKALDAIDFSHGPADPLPPRRIRRASDSALIERLVDCPYFVLDRWRLDAPRAMGGDQRFHFIAVLSGQVRLAGDPNPLGAGGTCLVPAALGPVLIEPVAAAVMLDVYLPAADLDQA